MTTGKTAQQVIDEFRRIHQSGYLEFYSDAILNHHNYWNSETYKHSYAQNLDLKAVRQIAATTPVVFGETFTADINGQSYVVSKCIRESDQSFCYTVMEDGERQRLPDGSSITSPDGKKYEANILYASNGKPLTDRQGCKSGGYGYWDEQDGWSLKLVESRMQAQENFSRRNNEKAPICRGFYHDRRLYSSVSSSTSVSLSAEIIGRSLSSPVSSFLRRRPRRFFCGFLRCTALIT